jgi:beta-mannosidase
VESLPAPLEELFLSLRLTHGEGSAENELFLCAPKRCELEQPGLRSKVHRSARGLEIELVTERPAFYVHPQAPGLAGRFSDSCFTLLPGRPRRIEFLPAAAPQTPGAEAFQRALQIRHLRGSYR